MLKLNLMFEMVVLLANRDCLCEVSTFLGHAHGIINFLDARAPALGELTKTTFHLLLEPDQILQILPIFSIGILTRLLSELLDHLQNTAGHIFMFRLLQKHRIHRRTVQFSFRKLQLVFHILYSNHIQFLNKIGLN